MRTGKACMQRWRENVICAFTNAEQSVFRSLRLRHTPKYSERRTGGLD